MSHFLAHSPTLPRPPARLELKSLLAQAYEEVAQRSKVNADKKRKYLRAAFIQKFLEKQDIFVTEAYVANSMKTLDRRQNKEALRKSSLHKKHTPWGIAPLIGTHDSRPPRDLTWSLKRIQKLQYHVRCDLFYEESCGVWSTRQRSGFEVTIWLDLDATRKAMTPHIVVTSPWQLSRVASFTCSSKVAPELEDRSRASNENNWDFPKWIAQAILQGNAREVEQVVDLHYTAADLNRLLHLHVSSHEPITCLVVTYNLIRQAPPHGQDRFLTLHRNAAMPDGGTHRPENPPQLVHPPSTFAYPQNIGNAYSPAHLTPCEPEASGFASDQYGPSPVQWHCHHVSNLSSQPMGPDLVSSSPGPQLGAWINTIHDAAFEETWLGH